ncbi:F0F1 ATP synthase subunit delta [Bifidobacterium margollesii]|uniref:ATP synthase subunit delta n=1 Tax=Bifidobacterium margollesii TaxID=2020964 RepID=A0A2N5JBA8_9BIFI|nr:F0F1 ATP synthase subunit delta [Bifidobacterium margollesii]
MHGETSLSSVRAVRGAFYDKLAAKGTDARAIGAELFDLAELLDDNRQLERSLTDPARSADDKVKLITTILNGHVDPLTLEVAQAVASRRWSRPEHIADAVEDVAIDALLANADARDVTAQVSFQLADLHSALLNLPVVRQRLSDPHAAPEQRVEFLDTLLKGQSLDPITIDLAEHATRNLRNRRYLSTINWVIDMITEHRGRSMVTVTSAVPLKDEQIVRIKNAYRRKLNRKVYVNCVVDPRVLGGMRIQVGSEVTDNTVAAQLQNLKRAVA